MTQTALSPAPPATGSARGLVTITLALLTTVACWLGLQPVGEQSAFLHLAIGRQLLAGGFGLPDPWVAAVRTPYVATEGVPGIVAFLLNERFGLPAIAWMRCFGILALLAALLVSARRTADGLPAAVAAGTGLVGATYGLTARPQLLGLVFVSACAAAWWGTAQDLRPRWWLVPATWVAAMVHGLWIVGVGVGVVAVAGFALDRRLRRAELGRLAAVPVLSLLAAAATPLGPALLLTPLTVGRQVRPFVQEWQATSAQDPIALVTLAMLGLVVLTLARSPGRTSWFVLLQLGVAAAATLTMERTIAIGAILATPLLAQSLQHWRGTAATPLRTRTVLRGAAALAVVAAAAAPVATLTAAAPVDVPERLRGTLAAIAPGTTILSDPNMGSYVEWVAPGLRPVLDSRAELYSAEQHVSFARMMAAAPGWDRLLQHSGATHALVLADSPIAAALTQRQGWVVLGDDADHVLLRAP